MINRNLVICKIDEISVFYRFLFEFFFIYNYLNRFGTSKEFHNGRGQPLGIPLFRLRSDVDDVLHELVEHDCSTSWRLGRIFPC